MKPNRRATLNRLTGIGGWMLVVAVILLLVVLIARPARAGDGGPSVGPLGGSISTCPVETEGRFVTEIIGGGMGNGKIFKKQLALPVPNSGDVVELYGQLAGKYSAGVKHVRFFYPNNTYVQVNSPPTAPDFIPGAIFWYGTDLSPATSIRGRWFLYPNANKPPRAMVLYPTYETEGQYANTWKVFDNSYEYEAYWGALWQQTVTQTLDLPGPQAPVDIVVQVALVDVNGDGRTAELKVAAGGVDETVILTAPANGKLLNIVTVTLEDVPAGTDQVELTLFSPTGTGDSVAMIGAAAHYSCSEVSAGSITIRKLVVGPIPDTDWGFSGPNGAFTLPAAGGDTQFTLLPGQHTFTETQKDRWSVVVNCNSGESGFDQVQVDLAAGEYVTCTFTNTYFDSGSCVAASADSGCSIK